MAKHFPLMIPGAKGKSKLDIFAPFDNKLIATADTADAAGVDTAIATAYKLYRNKDLWLAPAKRLEILSNAMHIMKQREDELAIEAAREGGKPLMDSKVEVARAIDGLKICMETLRTQAGEEIPMNLNAASFGRLAMTRYEPIGVVAAISAFNHPLNLIVHQVGPAVAVGCPVIVKPAEDTPISCFNFVNILYEAGLPEEWCQCFVVDDLAVAEKFVTDSRVAFLSFIGSAKVGWMLRSKLTPGARCALEHGGVAPAIVAQDADLDQALPLLAKAGLYHAGQVCVSAQRVFVHESIVREFANRLTAIAKAQKIGDPTLPETEIGPIIRRRELERIKEWVDEAVEQGAELLCGGKPFSESCYESTILYDPPKTAKVSTLEIFGPVICVYPYTNLDEIIDIANSLPYSFQACVFTKDIDTALRCYSRLDASAVMVNEHTAFRVDWMPFAGLKQSGLGVGGINYTMEDMQIKKLLVIKSKDAGIGS